MRVVRFTALALIICAAVMGVGTPALAYPCDQACQWQWEQQRQNALPRTDFYDAPDPLRWAPAGTVIRQQDTTDYRVGGHTAPATRILYHSRTSDGDNVAASAVLLVPPGSAPPGGWPVVADAHGASGFGRDCAPSLMRDLYHGDQMMRFVERGWAVVAPDYAGLGTTGQPEFVNKTAEANDVIAAVRAAQRLNLDLSRRWVLWGHSQGGGAALGVAEAQAERPDPHYLGAVVTSPAADLRAVLDHVADQPGLGGFVPLVAAGAKVTHPTLDLDQVLAPPALNRLDVIHTGCLGVVSAVYADLYGANLLAPGALAEPRFSRFLRDNTTGGRRVGGPILLLQGDADTVIPRNITDRVAANLCAQGADLDYRTYPGLEHDTYPGYATGIDDGAMDDILAWTASRFASEPAASTCP